MTAYTVMLMYPDYASAAYGEETYMTFVEAETVTEAQEKAQEEAWKGLQGDLEEEFGEPSDFAVLMVIEGNHYDIKRI